MKQQCKDTCFTYWNRLKLKQLTQTNADLYSQLSYRRGDLAARS